MLACVLKATREEPIAALVGANVPQVSWFSRWLGEIHVVTAGSWWWGWCSNGSVCCHSTVS